MMLTIVICLFLAVLLLLFIVISQWSRLNSLEQSDERQWDKISALDAWADSTEMVGDDEPRVLNRLAEIITKATATEPR